MVGLWNWYSKKETVVTVMIIILIVKIAKTFYEREKKVIMPVWLFCCLTSGLLYVVYRTGFFKETPDLIFISKVISTCK